MSLEPVRKKRLDDGLAAGQQEPVALSVSVAMDGQDEVAKANAALSMPVPAPASKGERKSI
jgi:hypothetical protein